MFIYGRASQKGDVSHGESVVPAQDFENVPGGSLGISGVTRLWGFEQSGGTHGDPIKQVAIPFDGKGFYTRVFSSGTWGGWSYTSLSSFLPSLASMRSFSEARISSTTIRQDVLSTDHATLFTRTKVDGGLWSAWTATPVINLKIPVL